MDIMPPLALCLTSSILVFRECRKSPVPQNHYQSMLVFPSDEVAQKKNLSDILYPTFTVTQGKEHSSRNLHSFLDCLFRTVIVTGFQRVDTKSFLLFVIGSMSHFSFRTVNSIKSVIISISLITDYC